MSLDDQDTTDIPVASNGRSVPLTVEVEISGRSDMGRARRNNEDHFHVARVSRSLETMLSSLPPEEARSHSGTVGYMMIVADGMGGAAAGEVASEMAIRTLVDVLLDVPDWVMRLDGDGAEEVARRATRYYAKVNEELARRAREEPQLRGMGTTMTLAYSIGTGLFIAHVGDSRAYLLRDGRIQQITRDHTHAQALLESGVISSEQVATHRLRHVLTNALGVSDRPVDVEVHRLDLHDGDRLLLCTDGLTEMVDDETISEALAENALPAETCTRLIELALEAGGRDNVTVITAHYSVGGGSV